jgi:hypothetical protein
MVAGLVGGGLIGYFRFGRSVAWATVLGIAFAVILARATWKHLQDPGLAQQRSAPGRRRMTAVRLGLPWAALALATVVGLAAQSWHAFVIVMAVGLAVAFVLRFTIWR